MERHRGARSPSDRSLVFALRACGQLGLLRGPGARFLFLLLGQTARVCLLLGLLRGADASSTALQLHAAQPAADLAGQIEADEALLSALASCGACDRRLFTPPAVNRRCSRRSLRAALGPRSGISPRISPHLPVSRALEAEDAEYVFLSPNQHSRDTDSAVFSCARCIRTPRTHAVL